MSARPAPSPSAPRAAALAAVLSLSACSYLPEWLLHDHAKDYLAASSIAPTRAPPGLDTPATAPRHPVPGDQGRPEAPVAFALGPPPSLLHPSLGEVRLQRLGERRWMVVDLAPERVWPLARAFFSDSQLPLARIDARAGVLETDWLKPEKRAPERYRLTLALGLRPGSSELVLVQHSGGGDWPDTASDVVRRDEMLQALATYMVDAPAAPVSRLAASLAAARERSRIEDDAQGRPQLHIDLRYDRGWATIGQALEHAGFEIVDRDRSAGIYYLSSPRPRGSKLRAERRLLPSRERDGKRGPVDIDQLPPERRLELRVRRDGDAEVLSAFHRPGLSPAAARELLERLRAHLA